MLAGIHPHETYTCLLWEKKITDLEAVLYLQGSCGAKSLRPAIWGCKPNTGILNSKGILQYQILDP